MNSIESRRALVVEDEPFFSAILCRLLAQLEIDCLVVGDGHAATAMLRHARYDVIIVDLRLPNGDGPALIEMIEADPALAARAVIVTAYPTVARCFATRLTVLKKSDIIEIRAAVSQIVDPFIDSSAVVRR